jgi:methionine-rich copper-binding protein CopC
MGDRGTRKTGLLLAVIAAVLCVLIPATPAAAHNSLNGSDPKDGARLATAPARVRLTFLAKVDPTGTKITVTGPEDVPAQTGPPVFDGSRVTVPFTAGPAGLYLVRYEVPSGDGHPVKGQVRFTLTVGAIPALSASPSAPPSVVPVATSAVPASPVAAAGGDDGGTPWWPWAVGGVLVLAAAVAGVLLFRRRAT